MIRRTGRLRFLLLILISTGGPGSIQRPLRRPVVAPTLEGLWCVKGAETRLVGCNKVIDAED
jgi:hypothetical protein